MLSRLLNPIICGENKMNELRGRAWRRSKTKVKGSKRTGDKKAQWISDKNWKHMYTRAEKLRRARQLKIEYPIRTVRQTLDSEVPLETKHVTNLCHLQ